MVELIQFPSEMVKTCWFATLRDIGYSTSVSIANQLPKAGFPSQSLKLSLQLFDSKTALEREKISLGDLSPGERININIEEILGQLMIQNDVVGVIHQTPSRMALSNEVSISREDLYRWISISDEFVGYRNIRSGLKSGLHYQSGPMNDARISSSRSIIMQSPKIVVSDRLDTQLLVFTPSSDKHNESVIPFHLVILDIDGFPVAETSVTLGMRQRALISVKQVLTEAGSLNQFIAKGGFGMMVGLAMNGNVIPLSLATDISGGLAIDHTLPPPYYVYRWNSEERKRTTHELVRKFFSHLVESQ